MDDKEKITLYEQLFAQIIKPIRNVPFNVIVKGLSGFDILPIDPQSNVADKRLISALEKMIDSCVETMRASGIASRRANEVGNYAEPFVAASLTEAKFKVEAPRGRSGRGKSTGYPDLLFYDEHQIPAYLEIKTYNRNNRSTTQRSFRAYPLNAHTHNM